MPYFFILPCYLLLLLALGIFAVVKRKHPAGACAAAGAIGTIPGILLANLAVTGAGLLPAAVSGHLDAPQIIRQITAAFAAVMLLLGPFIASAFGVLAGFTAGCAWACKRSRAQAMSRSITSAAE